MTSLFCVSYLFVQKSYVCNFSWKVVPATFLLVCFLVYTWALVKLGTMRFISLQKLFSFSSESNFSILNFQISRVIKCLSINKKYILLNNLGSKHGLLMKFGLFISYSKRNNFNKKFYKRYGLKTSSRPFRVCKELTTTSIGK